MLDLLIALHALRAHPAAPAPRPQTVAAQSLSVPATVAPPELTSAPTFTATAPDVTTDLLRRAPATPRSVAKQVAAALTRADPADPEGQRFDIVATALGYLGDPYVLDGATHAGIDCSGLTMQAYRSIGITLDHYVPSQDAVATVEPASAAEPGDLSVFDDENHIAVYLGNGEVAAAPAPDRNVEIEPLSEWSGVPFHFSRVLPQGATK